MISFIALSIEEYAVQESDLRLLLHVTSTLAPL